MRAAAGQLLDLIGDVAGELELTAFRTGLLHALRAALPADWISITEVGPQADSTFAIVEPQLTEAQHRTYAQYATDNPLVRRYLDTQDGRAYRFSDVATADALRSTELYQRFYATIGLNHQIAFTLPHDQERIVAVVLSRRDRDFTDTERDLLNVARPFLIQSYRNAILHTQVLGRLEALEAQRRLPLEDPLLAAALTARGVTARQAQVLALVAGGDTDRRAADRLGLSERTVQKHLQACFAKLDVNNRADAVDRAWSYCRGLGSS